MSRDKGGSAFDDVIDDEEPDSTEEPGDADNADDGKVVSKDIDTPSNDSTSPSNNDTKNKQHTTNNDSESSVEEPAFPYNDAERESVYVKPETWETILDVKFDVRDELRRSEQLRNIEQREIDEALLSLAAEELAIEDIAERITDTRKQS